MSIVPDLGVSLAAGALTTLSPCVLPLLPLVVGSLVQGHRAAPWMMGLGMAFSFAVLGMLIGGVGDALGLEGDRVRMAGAIGLIVFGTALWIPRWNAAFVLALAPLANRASQAAQGVNQGSLGGAFILGGLLGVIWSPCSGPMLGATLSLVASEGGALRGGLLLGLFGLGAALPLIGVAYASRSGFGRLRIWVIAHTNGVRRGLGLLLITVGLAILSGADKWLEAQINQRLPDAWVSLTTRL